MHVKQGVTIINEEFPFKNGNLQAKKIVIYLIASYGLWCKLP